MSESSDNRSIRIQESADGSAIVAGDGNTIYVIHQTTAQQTIPTVAGASGRLGLNPYKGLAAFQERDADNYFGREAQVKRLWKRFQTLYEQSSETSPTSRFLPILGPSGSGKSSLVRAGFIPELARRTLPGKQSIRVVVMLPGESPLKSLAGVLAKLTQDDQTPAVIKKRSYEAELRQSAESGRFDFLQDVAQMLPDIQISPLVVLVDQFEEIYSLCKEASERQAFIENLLYAAGSSTGYVTVVVTLRSDFLDETQRHPALNQMMSSADYNPVVQAMMPDELRQAIAQPARQAGHPLDEATVELLALDTSGRDGALPLLQFALTRIWEGLSEGKLSAEIYREMGGVGGALAGRAQSVYTRLSPERQDLARRLMLGLVRVSPEGQYTRRRVLIENLLSANDDREQVQAVIDRLAASGTRLVTVSSDEQGEDLIEITHEALLRHWPLLQDWLTQNNELLLQSRRIEDAALAWKAKGFAKGYLLYGAPLIEAQKYNQKYGKRLPLSRLSLDYLRKSFQQRSQQRVKILGIAAIPLLLLLLVSEYFVREIKVKESYASLSTYDSEKINRSILYLVEGCKAFRRKKGRLGILPFAYVSERLWGNCRSLIGTSLRGSDLRDVNIEYSELSGSDLRGSDFTGSQLRKVYLIGVDLSGAHLVEADLSESELRGANLRGVNLTKATFGRAGIEGVYWDGATLNAADLSLLDSIEPEVLKNAELCETKLPDYLKTVDGNRDCD